MDSSVKPPGYDRYAADFLSAVNGPSSLNYSHPPPQYTPRDSYSIQRPQARQTAKQSEYYYSRPMATQESANSTRQDEYHHYRTNPNFYHNRDTPAADRNAPITTQNEYHCYKNQPEFYHHRCDGLNIDSTAPQGLPMGQAVTATENKLGQVAQQRGFYYARPPPSGNSQFVSPPVSQQAVTTSMRDAYYHRRDQGNLRK